VCKFLANNSSAKGIQKQKGVTVMKIFRRTALAAVGLLTLLSTMAVAIIQIDARNQTDESQREKAVASLISPNQRLVDQIGIFPPGYEEQFLLMLEEYGQAHGSGNTRVVEYQGYRLIVPSSKESLIADAQRNIDEQLAAQKAHTPSDLQQKKDKAVIRRAWGTAEVKYDPLIGAYIDDDGYQYVFSDGTLVSKSVGVTDALRKRWEERHLLSNAVDMNSPLLSEAKVRGIADSAFKRTYPDWQEDDVTRPVRAKNWDRRMALDYGDVKILIDRSNGEIVHFSKIAR
jgi:hypothetical protein